MRRPRGAPIVVCDCNPPHGWPLAVQQVGILRNGYRQSDFVWLVANTRANYCDDAETKARITGHCPQCKRFFDIRFETDAGCGVDPMTELLIALSDGNLIEIMTPHISMQAINRPAGHISTLYGRELIEPRWIKNAPSRTTTFSIWVNNSLKFDLLRQIDALLHEGFDRSRIPNWYPTGSEEQFRGWLKELKFERWKYHNELKRKQGLRPHYDLWIESENWPTELQEMIPTFLKEEREADRTSAQQGQVYAYRHWEQAFFVFVQKRWRAESGNVDKTLMELADTLEQKYSLPPMP